MCEALSKILTFNKLISVTFFWYLNIINKTVFAGQFTSRLVPNDSVSQVITECARARASSDHKKIIIH